MKIKSKQPRISLAVMLTGVLASILGLIFSATIITEKLLLAENADYQTSCSWNPIFSCTDVMQSWQASLFGPIPNPILGLVGFTAVLSFFLFAYLHKSSKVLWIVQTVGLVLAFIFCIWLATQAIFDIRVICVYCVGVWIMTSLLLTLSIRELAPKEWRSFTWVGFVITLVAFATMMFIGFMDFWLYLLR